MENIYDYAKNIKVITTVNGDKVITMNEAIFTAIRNAIHDASERYEDKGLQDTSDDLRKLWASLVDKNHESEK